MGASFNAIMREVKEGSGCTRGGTRFQIGKRQRTGEGLAALGTQDREGKPHGMKRTYNDDENDRA